MEQMDGEFIEQDRSDPNFNLEEFNAQQRILQAEMRQQEELSMAKDA